MRGTGNWQNFTQNDQEDASQTLDQQRLANQVNEITQIARTVGPNWATPEYDRNGNMTVIPQPKDMTLTYQGTWDAWNRLVKFEEPDGMGGWQNLAEYQYNGQTWRIVKKSYDSGALDETRHFYFTSRWQDIEERLGTTPSSADAQQQYIWGARYIDEIIVRDRDTDGNGSLDERLYATQDANWNVVATAGQSVHRIIYLAYGSQTFMDSRYELASQMWDITFGGYRIDLRTNILVSRRRWLSPVLGNWLARDPAEYIQTNYYQYVRSTPTRFVDATGMAPIDDVFAIPPTQLTLQLPMGELNCSLNDARCNLGNILMSRIFTHHHRMQNFEIGDFPMVTQTGIGVAFKFDRIGDRHAGCPCCIGFRFSQTFNAGMGPQVDSDAGPFYGGLSVTNGIATRPPGRDYPQGIVYVFGRGDAIFDRPDLTDDNSTLLYEGVDFQQTFDTCLMCLHEEFPMEVLGCVRWGFRRRWTGSGHGDAVPIRPTCHNRPSADFITAMKTRDYLFGREFVNWR